MHGCSRCSTSLSVSTSGGVQQYIIYSPLYWRYCGCVTNWVRIRHEVPYGTNTARKYKHSTNKGRRQIRSYLVRSMHYVAHPCTKWAGLTWYERSTNIVRIRSPYSKSFWPCPSLADIPISRRGRHICEYRISSCTNRVRIRNKSTYSYLVRTRVPSGTNTARTHMVRIQDERQIRSYLVRSMHHVVHLVRFRWYERSTNTGPNNCIRTWLVPYQFMYESGTNIHGTIMVRNHILVPCSYHAPRVRMEHGCTSCHFVLHSYLMWYESGTNVLSAWMCALDRTILVPSSHTA